MTSPDARRLNRLRITLAAGLALMPLVAPNLAQAQADGTPGNPPGTALGRAADRALGTPTAPDGTPGNPPGTATGRAADRVTGTPTTPDGTPGNPPGTALGRAADRAAGTGTTALLPPAGMAAGTAAVARPRLSQLIGANVYSERNERIGEVDDILLVPPAGAMPGAASGPTAIIQVGGFLGLGGRLVTLPLGDLHWNAEREHIVMPGATKESLGARPAFEYGMLRNR
ncbi:MAG: PRC-barrel domain-containing protein [Roseococcus sp.]|nr:PRC-barrel domain-containing protein [Roseococcus sp.]